MAFTFTGDMGCEFGPSTATLAGVSCHGDKKDALAQPSVNFPRGESILNRALSAICCTTALGSKRTGSDSRSAAARSTIRDATWFWCRPSMVRRHLRRRLTPLLHGQPRDPFKAWDSSITFDYMPKQWITFRWEYDYRHASVPYWTGRGGITPPGSGGVPYTNNGSPQFFACNDGNSSMQERFPWRKRPAERKAAAYGFPIYARTSRCLTSTLW